jgi:phosphopantetheinyl transferase
MQAEIVHLPHKNNPIVLAIWKLRVTDEELYTQWQSLQTGEAMPAIKAAHRRREWLGSRILIHALNLGALRFLENGKPVIEGGAISISHCADYVAVLHGSERLGLDVQLPQEQIAIIRSKFCSDSEWQWLQSHQEPLRALTLVWSAKEAIYKFWGEQVDFARDIEIMPFACSDELIRAAYSGVHGVRQFDLWHTTRESLEIVVAL